MVSNRLDALKMLCRICAKEEQNMIPIFGENGKKRHIREKIGLCLPIEEKTTATSEDYCGLCSHIVSDNDEALGCQGKCNQWFHCNCIGVSSDLYGTYIDDENSIWICLKCRTEIPFSPILLPNDQEKTTATSEDYCGRCSNIVNDNDEALGCQGKCRKWFHCNCIGVSSDLYGTYMDDENSIWICLKCRAEIPFSPILLPNDQKISIEAKIEGLSENRPIVYGTSAVICLQPATPPPPVAPTEPTLVESSVAAPQSDPIQPVMMSYLPSAAQSTVATTAAAPVPVTEGVYPQSLIQVPTTPGSEPIIYQNRQPPAILPASIPTPTTIASPASAPRRRLPQPKPMNSTSSLQRTSALSTSRRQNSESINGPPSKKAFLCKYCNKTFPDDIIDHHVSLHLRQSFITCLDCNKNFRSEEAMNRHRCGVNDLITLSDEEDLIIVSQS